MKIKSLIKSKQNVLLEIEEETLNQLLSDLDLGLEEDSSMKEYLRIIQLSRLLRFSIDEISKLESMYNELKELTKNYRIKELL